MAGRLTVSACAKPHRPWGFHWLARTLDNSMEACACRLLILTLVERLKLLSMAPGTDKYQP